MDARAGTEAARHHEADAKQWSGQPHSTADATLQFLIL
jgi:hypothetical protein